MAQSVRLAMLEGRERPISMTCWVQMARTQKNKATSGHLGLLKVIRTCIQKQTACMRGADILYSLVHSRVFISTGKNGDI